MSWQHFPSKDMHQGQDAATLNYFEAMIPEEDAIELGKKYAEKNGFEGFVVVPKWGKLFWKKDVMSLVDAPLYGCDCWVSSKALGAGTRITESALEQHRPVFHFTPRKMWMNDPNGMFYRDGVYHLYYQHHPYSTVWGPMHWGHATTSDLIHWQHQPVALSPDDLGYIFSGSCIVDVNNTSGFGREAIIAFFTHHNPKDRLQSQSIAYSMDHGQTFKMYSGNPVIQGEQNLRDPKVFWDSVRP
jgi:sucrose-6-phosphate hydrolase SacC (GH32 family)